MSNSIRARIQKLIDLENASKKYNDFLLNEYKQFIENFQTIYLFGAGECGRKAFDFLYDVIRNKEVFFIDDDLNKCGTGGKEVYRGIYCYSREKMSGCDPKKSLILITTLKYRDVIYNELFIKGPFVARKFASSPIGSTYINKGFITSLFKFKNQFDNDLILKAYDILADEHSREIYFRKIIGMRFGGRVSMHQFRSLPQYFPPPLMERLSSDEVFLDCGASWGDTVEEFRKQTNDKFKKIYSFEMDIERYKKFLNNKNTHDDRIIPMNFGLSNKDGKVIYDMKGSPSYCTEKIENPNEAQLRSGDSLVEDGTICEKVSFVKMDIEGAEMDALCGMEQLIKRDQPKLAISVYHKPEDLYNIPIYIKSLVPEYTIILRQHSDWMSETILYAYIS